MVGIYTSLLWLPLFQRIHVTFNNLVQSTGASMLHWCLLYLWRVPHLALEVIWDWPLLSGLLTVDCTVSLFCLCFASPQEVPLSAFHQWPISTLCLSVWGLPHQSQSPPSHSPPTSQYSYRALCISQLQDWCCHYSSWSWSATLAHPNTGTLVKQLLHPLYPNCTFYPSEGSCDAGHGQGI